MERILEIKIDKALAGMRIKNILTGHMHFSTRMITRLKNYNNGIMLNGVHVFVTHTVSEGDILSLKIQDEDSSSENVVPVKGNFDIVYEDEDILIVNKDGNTPVHPSHKHFYDSLGNYVTYYYQQKGENFVFRPVNRLDRHTSGLMVIAKNSFIHDALMKEMKRGEFYREYIALCHGIINENEGTISAPIARDYDSAIKRKISFDEDSGCKHAVTHFDVIKRSVEKDITLIHLKLETGRTHQIRLHLSYIGHPIIGDFLYGTEDKDENFIALHSCKVRLIHPITKKEIVFEKSPPFIGLI